MSYETLNVQFEESVCFLQLSRPAAGNSINDRMILECRDVLAECDKCAAVVVVSGLPDQFCIGADFHEMRGSPNPAAAQRSANELYDVWSSLAQGSFISVAHVRGKATAGGMGFVAACDVVIADPTAQFALSELLFGLFPACVMPFLIRRIGLQKANYLALTTQPIDARQALAWGLVDVCHEQSEALLRRQLARLRYVSKAAVGRYKSYLAELDRAITGSRETAVMANASLFTDPAIRSTIAKYVMKGLFPWEA